VLGDEQEERDANNCAFVPFKHLARYSSPITFHRFSLTLCRAFCRMFPLILRASQMPDVSAPHDQLITPMDFGGHPHQG
jgi:hypothetical protein